MMRVTRWNPDTCECIIDYAWDDALDGLVRTHAVSKVVSACTHHSNMDAASHYATVVDENARKNKFYVLALKNGYGVPDQNGHLALQEGASITFAWDKTRTLLATCVAAPSGPAPDPGLPAPTPSTPAVSLLQDLADQTFGPGKVVVS